jgi:hypothetical protein
MGAWGYGSFENDTAMDFIAHLFNEKALKKLVSQKKLSEDSYHEVRVSAEILIHLHKLNDLWVDQETMQCLIKALETIEADTEWYKTWVDDNEAAGIKKQVKTFIKKLKTFDAY